MDDLGKNGSGLSKFWLSCLNLCQLLLNLDFSTRSGDWELYLACVEEVILCTFAYDHQNYTQRLIPFLNDMSSLPVKMRDGQKALENVEFSVQMSCYGD